MIIGVVTYWNSLDNYGQLLQCYALQNYLKSLGHDVFLIKYEPVKNIPIWKKKLRKSTAYKILCFFSKKRRINIIEEKLLKINTGLNQRRKFDNFRKLFLVSVDKVYYSIDELREMPPIADVYICGSDQVWNNPLSEKNTAGWFLDFGSSKVKRISYAASIGRELKQSELKIFARYLSRFNAISVREWSSQLICDKLGFCNSVVTLDPTLLLPIEEYYKLLQGIQFSSASSYLFMYILNIRIKEEIYWKSIDEYIQEENLKVNIVYSSGYLQARELIPDYRSIQATIPEWLLYLKNASCVITSSFHGVVFCIKMNKPFLVMLLSNQYSGGNVRVTSLLKELGLVERIFNPIYSVKDQMERFINWDNVGMKLLKLQNKSFAFLNSNL